MSARSRRPGGQRLALEHPDAVSHLAVLDIVPVLDNRCATLVLWQQPGGAPAPFDPIAIWRGWADDVTGHGLDAGHILPEERPDEVAAALHDHFATR